MDINTECQLIGACVIAVQKVEFNLYGIASHLSHLPEAKERRFRELTPEQFLRGDPKELKATLGQIEKTFGEKLSLSTDELTDFIEQRNLIAHNYYRLTRKGIKGAKQLQDPEAFLRGFLVQCGYWEKVLYGLLSLMLIATAKKQNRESEVKLNSDQLLAIDAYRAHVEKRLTNVSI